MHSSVKTWLNRMVSQIKLITTVWLRPIVAVILIILGIITFPLPLPIGLILIIIGLAMLISSSHRFAKLIKQYRSKYSGFNKSFEKTKQYLPASIRRALEKTDP